MILVLCLPEKSSFTLSKLRLFGLRKPKNPSCYTTSTKKKLPDILSGNLFFTWSYKRIGIVPWQASRFCSSGGYDAVVRGGR